MKLSLIALLFHSLASGAAAFCPSTQLYQPRPGTHPHQLRMAEDDEDTEDADDDAADDDVVSKVEKLVAKGKEGKKKDLLAKVFQIFSDAPEAVGGSDFDKVVKGQFPGALSNEELESKVVQILEDKGFEDSNTLLATSLCADELARRLEDDFVKIFGKNFNLGGLSGFPFAGNTGFGAMSAHIPDDGFSLVIYGPHVGVAKDGTVGKVERKGIELVDNCCGSAIAASGYLQGITDGGAVMTSKLRAFTDFQQVAVNELILPHGARLAEAENRMVELPYALYESQDLLMADIVQTGVGGIKKGLALLGGLQINTSPETQDYFLPLRFDYLNNKGEVLENLLPKISK